MAMSLLPSFGKYLKSQFLLSPFLPPIEEATPNFRCLCYHTVKHIVTLVTNQRKRCPYPWAGHSCYHTVKHIVTLVTNQRKRCPYPWAGHSCNTNIVNVLRVDLFTVLFLFCSICLLPFKLCLLFWSTTWWYSRHLITTLVLVGLVSDHQSY